jgi:hypothetical protein
MYWKQNGTNRFDLMVWRIPITNNGDSQTIPLTPPKIVQQPMEPFSADGIWKQRFPTFPCLSPTENL